MVLDFLNEAITVTVSLEADLRRERFQMNGLMRDTFVNRRRPLKRGNPHRENLSKNDSGGWKGMWRKNPT